MDGVCGELVGGKVGGHVGGGTDGQIQTNSIKHIRTVNVLVPLYGRVACGLWMWLGGEGGKGGWGGGVAPTVGKLHALNANP